MAAESYSHNVLMDHAETLRKMWQHEDNIANNRLTWFNTTQRLLFASLAPKPATTPLLRRLDCYRLHGVKGCLAPWPSRNILELQRFDSDSDSDFDASNSNELRRYEFSL